MRRIVGGALVVVVLGVSGAGLTACGGGSPEPSRLGSKSSSPTPSATSASPTSTAPSDPAAFVRYYIDAANTAQTSGDVGELRSLSGSGCDFCSSTATSLKTFHDNGGSYQGDASWHVSEVGRPSGTGSVKISAYVKIDPHEVISKRGASPKPERAHTLLFDFTLTKENGQWTVENLDVNGS